MNSTSDRVNQTVLRRRLLYCLLALAAFAAGLTAAAPPAHADIGPKPSMAFRFEYQIPRTAITSGQQIECQQANCADGVPLREVGPQRFWCEDHGCQSLAYGYDDYHRLVITFADGVTRTSNVFATMGRGGDFVVTVTPDGLRVERDETARPWFQRLGETVGCIPGWGLTLVIETLVAGLFVATLGMPRALLGVVPVASLITLPAVWFVFPLLRLPWLAGVGIAESFAVVCEGGIICAFTHRTLPLRQIALLSLVMNGASFLVGLTLGWPL
jgi:hypothetical protein